MMAIRGLLIIGLLFTGGYWIGATDSWWVLLPACAMTGTGGWLLGGVCTIASRKERHDD